MKLPKLKKPELGVVPMYFFPMFWGSKNPELVTQSVQKIWNEVSPGAHFADNFVTWTRNNSMLDDEVFVHAWKSSCESDADRAIVW